MPIYEFACEKCSHTFEEILKVSSSPKSKCPKCGGKAERKVSLSSFQLKGGGWYVTDYAKKTGKSEKKESSESSASTENASPSSGTSLGASSGSESSGD